MWLGVVSGSMNLGLAPWLGSRDPRGMTASLGRCFEVVVGFIGRDVHTHMLVCICTVYL